MCCCTIPLATYRVNQKKKLSHQFYFFFVCDIIVFYLLILTIFTISIRNNQHMCLL